MISPSTVIDLSLTEWAYLASALFLFLGPGYGLLTFHPHYRRLDVTQTIALAIGASIAFWSVLLVWLHALDVILTPRGAIAIFSFGWALGLLRARFWKWRFPSSSAILGRVDISRILLWSVLALCAGVSLWALRDSVAGLGSDSYHHTLIAQLIVDRGGLPDNYEPYAPLVTFTYHFAFHGMVAAMAWLTGLKPIVLTPILGQIFMVVATLSVAYFTEVTIRDKWAATFSAIFAGLVLVFPAYLVNWGRDTQLTGLVLLPVFLGLIWEWAEFDLNWPAIPLFSLVAAGLALAHYRVTLMAASGALVLIVWAGISHRISWPAWRALAGKLLLALIVAGLLVAPWGVHLLNAQQHGYAVDLGPFTPAVFSLERLGPSVLNYATNRVVIALIILAITLGWWEHERIVMALSVWAGVMLIFSQLQLAAISMDTISVFISLYFPAAVIIGWLVVWLFNLALARFKYLCWVMWLAGMGLSLWGTVTLARIAEPGEAYVGLDDLRAMAWIQTHTPASARFMVNTFHWDFQPDFVIGSDAGYWIPLLAGRGTATIPMTYPVEKMSSPDLAERLVALDQLGGHLASPEALSMLKKEGVSYVYFGQRGGQIVVAELLGSRDFELIFQSGSAYVFHLIDGR